MTSHTAQSTKIALRNVGSSTTSPVDQQQRKEILVTVRPCAIVFFIGGAGDKESYYGTGPFHNIREVRDYCDPAFEVLKSLDLYRAFYLGYNEVCGEADLKKNVLDAIKNKASPVYIIGHSLGGWNGAHLSGILSEKGYSVEMLITLDPVGQGIGVHTISDLYRGIPAPAAQFWINIRAEKEEEKRDMSDYVAKAGGQWIVKTGPHLNYIAKYHHASALNMFVVPLKDKKSAANHFIASVAKRTTQ